MCLGPLAGVGEDKIKTASGKAFVARTLTKICLCFSTGAFCFSTEDVTVRRHRMRSNVALCFSTGDESFRRRPVRPSVLREGGLAIEGDAKRSAEPGLCPITLLRLSVLRLLGSNFP